MLRIRKLSTETVKKEQEKRTEEEKKKLESEQKERLTLTKISSLYDSGASAKYL